MTNQLMPYEKAGWVFRVLAWVQMAAFTILVASIAITMVSQGKISPLASFMALLCMVVFLLYFCIGKAIQKHKGWGRTVGIIMGALMLFGFPIGTLIGAYILWCLIKGWDELSA